MTPAAARASVLIVSRGMPNSPCATLPVIIAAIAAVATAMMRKAALPISEAYFIALPVANRSVAERTLVSRTEGASFRRRFQVRKASPRFQKGAKGAVKMMRFINSPSGLFTKQRELRPSWAKPHPNRYALETVRQLPCS